ncbi:MAG: LysR family transcriptional regulator [Haliangiales bacterium]
MVDPDILIRFLEVVEAGSFSGAARELGISRQAVQRSIDTLEQRHNVPLFERTTRQLRLTDAGRRLVPAARAVRRASDEAGALLSAAASHPSGRLRLSAPPLFAETVLTRVIPRFLERWPDVDLEARFDTALIDPFTADIDLTIRIGREPPADTYATRLGQAGLLMCATPAYLAAHPAPEHPNQLTQHQLLAYGRGAQVWRFDRPERGPAEADSDVERAVAVEVAPRLQTNSAPVMVAACLAGLGILRTPLLAVSEQLASGALVEVLPAWRIPAADVWALYGHRVSTDPTLQAFLDVLRAASW